MKTFDAIWVNATLVTCEGGYGLVENAAIAVNQGRIAWLGQMSELPAPPEQLARVVHQANHRCITPGLVDCHTHLVFAGQRANEFELRLQGASYQEIAQQGGGIQSTVRATRSATFDDLLSQSLARAKACQANGTTTIEIKSGYGLDWDTERKMLMVAKQLSDQLPLTVKRTFLGAHTTPLEYKQNQEAYVDEVCQHMIPNVVTEQLADAVDVFCETIAFTPAQTEKIFQTAQAHGLQVKCHAEQLSNQGAAMLAAKYRALSVDHLEYLSEEGIAALVESKTVAVLLPGAFYFLKETKKPPVHALLKAGVPIALATDCNPGTSPILSLPLIMNMGCTLYGLTPEQALLGVTIHAAQALGLRETHGSLTVGKVADFAIWNVKQPVEIIYYLGYGSLLDRLVKDGKAVS